MSSLEDRIKGMLIGALIADASAQPIHWIYDTDKLASQLNDLNKFNEPEFVTPSLNAFYRIDAGLQTVYGDQMYVLLQSIAAHQAFNAVEYAKDIERFFGNMGDGGYGVWPCDALPRDQLPQTTPWRNASIKAYLNALLEKAHLDGESKWLHSGLSDDQADSHSKIAPLVALHLAINANRPNRFDWTDSLVSDVITASSITQSGDIALASAVAVSRLLSTIASETRSSSQSSDIASFGALIERWVAELTNPERPHPYPAETIIAEALRQMLDSKCEMAHFDVVKQLGLGCGVPFSLVNSIHSILSAARSVTADATSCTDDGDRRTRWFELAVRQTLKAGGDNASRSCIIGACIGAFIGFDALPSSWVTRTIRAVGAIQSASTIVSLTSASKATL